MRLVPVALACALPAIGVARADEAAPPAQVIGGDSATSGKWPDVAAILFPEATGDEARCTGTLIAPTIVLTAGHCYDPSDPPLPDHVLIGTSSLARRGDGETIAIKRGIPFPSASTTEDVAVLVLAWPSSRAPRKLATGWATLGITNGAAISLVGFGAVDQAGTEFVNELQEAHTTITDADCSSAVGCNAAAQPAGELGAGGMGIDTCPGDSGGPLYLTTGFGTFLAGVTSRSYDDATVPCSDGGIYARPDKVAAWIERAAGVSIARAPGPEADPLVAVHGDGDDTRIAVHDPESDAHRFEIVAPPAHGTAKVRSDGAVRVCVDPAAPAGDDAVTVLITDTRHDGRALPITIPIRIEDGAAPPSCDLDAFSSGGCCDSGGGGSGGAIPLAIGVLAIVLGRRR
jgi:endonuclease G